MPSQDHRLSSPAALRNRDPILDLLQEVLPVSGTVLEIASGSGEHIIHFAGQLTDLTWQPSDPSPEARASIEAWGAEMQRSNLCPPLDIDATGGEWPVQRADAIIAINLIHISPWAATEGLMRNAGKLLPSGAPLVLYGPYRQAGQPLVASNAEFDEDLKSRNPAWGIRDLADVTRVAAEHGLALVSVTELPANNLGVVLKRR